MATLREVVTDWTTPAGGGFKTVMHWDATFAPANVRADLGAFWTTIAGALDNNVSWLIETAGRLVDDATGNLVGAWTDATLRTGVGQVAGECVADATQVLMRWDTGAIVGHRFLIGRTFIPGMAAAQLVGGNTSQILRTTWDGAAATMIAAAHGFGVWHRPVGGSGGVFRPAAKGTTQVELAVLRRRRR